LVAALVIEDSLCMAPDEHQPLLLILARNLVTNLAMPALLTDADARLIFFNEAAALILGQRFEEVGRLRRDEWATRFGPFDDEGHPEATDSLPLAVALRDGRPSQARFRICAHDQRTVEVEVTAVPLIEPDHFEGALVVFWPVDAATDATD
jgi:PAS domain-containing protein